MKIDEAHALLRNSGLGNESPDTHHSNRLIRYRLGKVKNASQIVVNFEDLPADGIQKVVMNFHIDPQKFKQFLEDPALRTLIKEYALE